MCPHLRDVICFDDMMLFIHTSGNTHKKKTNLPLLNRAVRIENKTNQLIFVKLKAPKFKDLVAIKR